eukprot:129457-Chlamydomonas_euryale.AAC.4
MAGVWGKGGRLVCAGLCAGSLDLAENWMEGWMQRRAQGGQAFLSHSNSPSLGADGALTRRKGDRLF